MQFVDHVQIVVESGAGGDGLVAWRREKYVPNGGPAGGDGGRGGDVIIEASTQLHTLLDFRYQSQFNAEPGEKGRIKNQHGKHGPDKRIMVPCGTIVRDSETGHAIGDLTADGDRIIVAFGGRGGRGNARFSTAKRQAPQFAEPGEPGIQRTLDLELKLLADVGLIGFPNAGKSTLISTISAAKPKIADYPFTTLTPNLGVVRKPSGDGIVVADIPGLIEGASQGIGLGHEFLRHIERTRVLLHLIDCSELNTHSPLESFAIINAELDHYGQTLKHKPQIVVLTKLDSVVDPDALDEVSQILAEKTKQPVHRISAVTGLGIEPLKYALFEQLEATPRDIDSPVPLVVDTKAYDHDDSAYDIVRQGKVIHVVGGKLERLIRVTDFRNPSAVRRTLNIFKAMGVFEALAAQQAQPGQTVIIGGQEFDYQPEHDAHLQQVVTADE